MKTKIRSVCASIQVIVCVTAFVLPVLASCTDTRDSQPSSAAAPSSSNGFIPAVTVIEIMESMMSPSAEAVWNSVAFVATLEGTIDSKPETEEDWQKLRWSAVTMAEASNALLIPGRRVDKPGVLADDPDELGPDEIQTLIENNRPAWIAFAQAMHATAMATIRVIDARDVEGLTDVGGAIDAACESCHMQFWYPE